MEISENFQEVKRRQRQLADLLAFVSWKRGRLTWSTEWVELVLVLCSCVKLLTTTAGLVCV